MKQLTIVIYLSGIVLITTGIDSIAADTTRQDKIAAQEALLKVKKNELATKEADWDKALTALNQAKKGVAEATKQEDKTTKLKEQQNAQAAADKAEVEFSQAHLEVENVALEVAKLKATPGSAEAGIAEEKQAAIAKQLTKDEEDEFQKRMLRDLGLSLTTGMCYVPDQGKMVPNFLIRWNIFQKRADAYRHAYLRKERNTTAAERETAAAMTEQDAFWFPKTYNANMIPAVSVLGGYGLAEVKYDTKAGQTKPFLVGGSLGLVNAKEASSAFHIDVGWLILQDGNFKKDGHFFVGGSLDLLHARDLGKYLLSLFDSKN